MPVNDFFELFLYYKRITLCDKASSTPATKVEKVESEPRFGVNIGDYSGRLRLLSGASSLANPMQEQQIQHPEGRDRGVSVQ